MTNDRESEHGGGGRELQEGCQEVWCIYINSSNAANWRSFSKKGTRLALSSDLPHSTTYSATVALIRWTAKFCDQIAKRGGTQAVISMMKKKQGDSQFVQNILVILESLIKHGWVKCDLLTDYRKKSCSLDSTWRWTSCHCIPLGQTSWWTGNVDSITQVT